MSSWKINTSFLLLELVESILQIFNPLPFIPKYVYVITTDNINTLISSIDVCDKASVTDLVTLHHALIVSTNIFTSLVIIWYHYLDHIMLQYIKKLFQ